VALAGTVHNTIHYLKNESITKRFKEEEALLLKRANGNRRGQIDDREPTGERRR